MAKVKFGWRIPAFALDNSPAPVLLKQTTDVLDKIQGKFASAWIADHFVPWPDWHPVADDTFECWTTLTYLAARYPQLVFGSIVLDQSYRNPALVAKMAATLQFLTGGRFVLGLGAGWKKSEYLAYGYEFPDAPVRIAQLAEAAQIIRRMWTETPATFQGKYYHVDHAYCEPKPDPMVPLMIGGGGEKLTLRVVAEHADWWNYAGGTPEVFAHKLDVLKRHCDAVRRDYNSIVRTWTGDIVAVAETEAEARRMAAKTPFNDQTQLVGTPEQVVDILHGFTDLGIEHFVLRFADFPNTAGIELFAEQVIPQFQ